MRRSPISFGVAVLLAVGLSACSRPAPPAEPIRAVRTLVVATDSAGQRHEYAAEIKPRVETRLSFRVAGKVTERRADLGDVVKAGQVLARLDAADLRLGQDASRAALASAEVSLRQAEQDFRRYQELRQQGFIGDAELERRETTLKVAQTQARQAQAQAGVQGNQAAYTTLVADAPGVVTAVEVEPGMVVAAGTTVVRVAHDGPRDAVFAVPEDRIGVLQAVAARKGTIEVRLWNDGARPMPAQIREIAAAADPATRTFLVKADLGAAPELRIGQTATVGIEMPKVAGIVKVPLSALREDHGKTTVWIVDPASMTTAARPVRIGGADGNEAIVTEGLARGERVVTAGVHVLAAGQKVKLYADPQAPLAAAAASAPTR